MGNAWFGRAENSTSPFCRFTKATRSGKKPRRLEPLERALLQLGLGDSRRWDAIEYRPDTSQGKLGHLPSGPVWFVRTDLPIVGVHCFDGSTPDSVKELLASLSDGVLWRLRKSESLRQLIISGQEGAALKLWFQPSDVDEGSPVIRSAGWTADRLVLEFDTRLKPFREEHSTGVEDVIGAAIASGMTEHGVAQEDFVAAWSAAPPGFRMDGSRLPVGPSVLPSPHGFNDAMQSESIRALANELLAANVAPGDYEGREATDLESTVVFPALRELLAVSSRPFDSSSLLQYALTQLECSLCQDHVDKLKRGWNERFPVLGYDPIERKLNEGRNAFRLSRAIRAVIEELIFRPGSGSLQPGRLEWRRLLSIADLCLASGIRSETNHYGLVPLATQLTGDYELRQTEIGEPGIYLIQVTPTYCGRA